MNFFEFIAQEVREYLAALGFRSLDEAIGHNEVLDVDGAVEHWKANGLDLAPILHGEAVPDDGDALTTRHARTTSSRRHFDRQLIADGPRPRSTTATASGIELPIRNVNRTRRHDARPRGHPARTVEPACPDGSIDVTLTGSAGQSFGAFLPTA